MRAQFSTYLDAVRFSACMAVVCAHFTFSQFIAGVPYQGDLAGIAVTVFFVLSGYVIAYVADQKETTLKQYAVSRLARIYSVAIPAIVLTLIIDFYLMHHGVGDWLPSYEYRAMWKYLPVFLVFGSELAGFHAVVFGDGVFWSLSYEVWYYVAFATFFYLRGVYRIVFGLVSLLILGPAPLIYFPIWILGAVIYHTHKRISVSPNIAKYGALLTIGAIIVLLALGALGDADYMANQLFNGWPRANLHDSMNFASYYIVGVLAGAHIFFAQYCHLTFLSGQRIKRAIVYAASFTFAIYLSHRPFMNFWAYVIRHDPSSLTSISMLGALVLLSCWLFGFISEKQKGRWRTLFRRLLNLRAAPLRAA